MHAFSDWAKQVETAFSARVFPATPTNLYDAAQYILALGGKRVRPVAVLMGNELFDELHPDAMAVAQAFELFHNFSLIHDDIMDRAPLRRGKPTTHINYGESTALLAGDVMLVKCYELINQIQPDVMGRILRLFNETAKGVCEGQQLDMDFEQRDVVHLDEYVEMITLKTSVLLAACFQAGAILGGAGCGSQQHLYAFGKNLGIAFQVQDDYLDCFGDPAKFGKQVGGDILSNKKTFLLIQALEMGSEVQQQEIRELLTYTGNDKVERMLALYRAIGVDAWANSLKQDYLAKALQHLEDTPVLHARKQPLFDLAQYLIQRDV
jgi:geranylgeranyl diphosphate synthase type II